MAHYHHHPRRRHRRTNATILFFFFLPLLNSQSFTPTTNTLVNCGSSSDAIQDGRDFISDDATSGKFRTSGRSISATDPRSSTDSSSPSSSIYRTANIFIGPFSYEFHVETPGTHFLRLHFSPFTTTDGYRLSAATFHVSALDTFTLLTKFSTTAAKPIIKEYILWVPSGELKLTFTPANATSIAFVNAIEVFTAPDNFIPEKFSTYVTQSGLKDFPVSTVEAAMETVFRVNAGGSPITAADDTLWRTWITDETFLYSEALAKRVNTSQPVKYRSTPPTREFAPTQVYSTAEQMNVEKNSYSQNMFNVTWVFPVSSGHSYFVRMHFCDFVSTTADELYYNVYLNNMTATKDLHPAEYTSETLAVPFFTDYVVDAETGGNVRVSVGRSMKSSDPKANAILNGVEIMKINNSVGSLDVENYLGESTGAGGDHRKTIVVLASLVSGAVVVFALLSALLLFFFCKRRKRPAPKPSEGGSSAVSKGGIDLSLHISHDELKLATNNFDDSLVIGSGGFGKVYKGRLQDDTPVAVKRGMPRSSQGHPEFENEVLVLSQIRHRHLVSLVGYCDEDHQMILVYEYMDKGTLKSYLYGGDVFLSWKQRLNICIGAARGLHYLHTAYLPGIIHRDVKSSNILLSGEELFAKVSDFGLSRTGPDAGKSHVSTVVKGSFGYVDPEYYKTQKLTDKSDVYSFGVVLLEVLCCRPAVDPSLPRDQMNLAEWAVARLRRGKLEEILDARLRGMVNNTSLKKFAEMAERCLSENGSERPTMGDVLWNLEYCLQLQERELREPGEDSVAGDELRMNAEHMSAVMGTRGGGESRTVLAPSGVFSQLMTNEGR